MRLTPVPCVGGRMGAVGADVYWPYSTVRAPIGRFGGAEVEEVCIGTAH